MTNEDTMKKRQPPDSVRIRDLINSSIARSLGWNRLRRLAPAASAARVVAMAADRAADATYVEYLTALSEMTSASPREQRAGVRRMAAVAAGPDHREPALHALRELVRTAAAPDRLSPEALALARRTLAEQHQHAVPLPHGDEDIAGGDDPDPSAARPLRQGPGGAPALTESARVLAAAVRQQPQVFSVAAGGAVAFCLAPVLVVLLFQEVMDRLWIPAVRTGQVDLRTACLLAVAILGLFAVRAGGLVATRLGGVLMRRRLQDAQQRKVVDKYAEAPVAWHADRRPAELIALAERSAERVSRPLGPLPLAVGSAVTLLVVIAALGHLTWWLALIGVATVAVLGALGIAFLRSAGPPAERARALRKQIFDLTGRGDDPAREAGSERPDPDRVAAFQAASDELRVVMIGLRRRRSAFLSLFCASPVAGMLLAVVIAGRHPLAGGVADLVTAVILLALLPAPVVAIGSVIAELPTGLLGLSRIETLCTGATAAAPGEPGLVLATAPAFSSVPACGKLDRLADSSAYLGSRRNSRPGGDPHPHRRGWLSTHRAGAATGKTGTIG
jgi:hypothetical protein